MTLPSGDQDAGNLRVKSSPTTRRTTAPYRRYGSSLINDSLKYQERTLKVRKSYLRKFRKVLPETKVARFFQVENKLDAITNFVLADQIPLIPEAPTSRPIAAPAN